MNTKKVHEILYRGSKWRKWDLQVHTKDDSGYVFNSNSSISNRELNNGEYSEVFIEHIYSIDNLGAVAITDHKSANWTDRIIEENKNYAAQNSRQEITIFPGVEVESSDGLHLLVIFNPKTQLKEVKRDYRKTTWKETIEHFLTAIGPTQDSNAPKTTESIMKMAEKWDALCIFAHVTSDKGFFRISSGSTKIRIYKHKLTQIFQIPTNGIINTGQRNIVEGKDPEYCNEQGTPKSVVCITASDAKKLSDIGTNNCWIKADTSFEGLKQIIYEPEERVYIGDDDPRKFAYPFLKSFEVENDVAGQFFIGQNNPIYFNSGLNVIIGSRGVGKSVLLDSSTLALDQQKVNPDSYVSTFLRKIKKPFLTCYMNTQGSSEGQIVRYSWSAERRQIEHFPFEYFFQKKIGRLAEARTTEEKNELSNFIYEHIFIELAKDALEKIEKVKTETLSSLVHSRCDIKEQEDIIGKEKDIEDQLTDLKKQLESYSREELKELYGKRAQIMKLQEIFSRSVDNLNEKIIEYDNFLKKFNLSEIDKIGTILDNNDDFVSKEIREAFKKEFNDIILKLRVSLKTSKSLLNKTKAIIESYKEKGELDEKFEIIKVEIQKKSKELGIQLSQQFDKTVREIQGKITELYSKKEAIVKAREIKKNLVKQRKELLGSYIKELGKTEKLLKNAFDTFCKQDGKILGDSIKVDFYKDVSIEDYVKVIGRNRRLPDIESSRKFPALRLQKVFEVKRNIQDIINAFRERNFKSWIEIEGVGSETVNYLEVIENTEEIAMLLEEILPSLLVTIKWKDKKGNYKPLSECSVGERSTAVLSIILVSGRLPLLIDQPEEDLDNFYIFKRLVPIIKTVKKRRQLIFATHDANIVINADAELILILKSPDGKHAEIEPATIENMEKRDDIITILEGGADAFAKREQKLRTTKGREN